MAYKPSLRSKNEEVEMELDIRPVMNLMVVLIPLLLAGAQWVKLSIIEINVPPTKAAGPGAGGETQENTPKEKQLKLGLKVVITHSGITIGNAQAILAGDKGEGPTVPLKEDGSYDLEKLHEKLVELKQKVAGKGFVDQDRVVITAESDVEYQTIIDVMDNIQTYKDDQGNVLALFPEVNFSKMIQ